MVPATLLDSPPLPTLRSLGLLKMLVPRTVPWHSTEPQEGCQVWYTVFGFEFWISLSSYLAGEWPPSQTQLMYYWLPQDCTCLTGQTEAGIKHNKYKLSRAMAMNFMTTSHIMVHLRKICFGWVFLMSLLWLFAFQTVLAKFTAGSCYNQLSCFYFGMQLLCRLKMAFLWMRFTVPFSIPWPPFLCFLNIPFQVCRTLGSLHAGDLQ